MPKTLTTQDLGSNLSFNVDQIEKDIRSLIKKHYSTNILSNISLLSADSLGKEKGFYLIFIKREGLENRRVTTTSFGCDVKVHEIIESVSQLLSDMMQGQDMSKMGHA